MPAALGKYRPDEEMSGQGAADAVLSVVSGAS